VFDVKYAGTHTAIHKFAPSRAFGIKLAWLAAILSAGGNPSLMQMWGARELSPPPSPTHEQLPIPSTRVGEEICFGFLPKVSQKILSIFFLL
jgi:hypothetical protein